jgi:antitoxin VapB
MLRHMTKRSIPGVTRVVKLLRSGRTQVIRIPREFELRGNAACITKEGNRLIIEPVAQRNFIAALRALGPLPPADRFPAIDDPAR